MDIKTIYTQTRHKRLKVLLILTGLLLALFFICTINGAVFIHPLELTKGVNATLLKLRLSRVVLGIVVGAALSASGCVFQGLLRNPLAEPYILGVSSGAGLGAVLAITLGWQALLPLIAFLGSLLTIVFVYKLSITQGRIQMRSLILTGVIIGSIFSSILMFLVSVSQRQRIHDVVWWLLGNLQIFDFKLLVVVAILSITGVLIYSFFSQELNAIALGEEEAHNLGIDVELVKKVLFVVSSLVTASCVCACGIIGFVGLIIPHSLRIIVGPDHRILIPATALAGACFLIVCDLLSRTVILPAELPIGVITALVGGPLFVYLLRKKSREF